MGDSDPFFEQVTFSHLKENPNCVREVCNQGGADTCYAFAVTACVHAESVLSQVDGNPLAASRQELMDCLHKVMPPKYSGSGEVSAPPKGLPNSFSHAFKYFEEIGSYPESDYPYEGVTNPICQEPLVQGGREAPPSSSSPCSDYPYKGVTNPICQLVQGGSEAPPSSSSPGDMKIFIGGYGRCKEENVIEALEKQPLVGRILANSKFRKWEGTTMFSGASDEEETECRRLLAKKKAEYYKERRAFLLGETKEEGSGRDEVPKEEKRGSSSEATYEGEKETCPEEDQPRMGAHAVLLVGHGIEAGIKCFLCQNSYGVKWGHLGYFKIPQSKVSQIYYVKKAELRRVTEEDKMTIREKVQKLLEKDAERIRKEDEDIMKDVKAS